MIPKRIRHRLGLRGNEQAEITERDGRLARSHRGLIDHLAEHDVA